MISISTGYVNPSVGLIGTVDTPPSLDTQTRWPHPLHWRHTPGHLTDKLSTCSSFTGHWLSGHTSFFGHRLLFSLQWTQFLQLTDRLGGHASFNGTDKYRGWGHLYCDWHVKTPCLRQRPRLLHGVHRITRYSSSSDCQSQGPDLIHCDWQERKPRLLPWTDTQSERIKARNGKDQRIIRKRIRQLEQWWPLLSQIVWLTKNKSQLHQPVEWMCFI